MILGKNWKIIPAKRQLILKSKKNIIYYTIQKGNYIQNHVVNLEETKKEL